VSVIDLVFQTHDLLQRLPVDHAFGGALALAYYSEPRGTLDVDVNVFVPFESARQLVTEFSAIGYRAKRRPDAWSPVAGVRLLRQGDRIALDLFFSIDEHYDEVATRKGWFPFGAERRELPFLSVEDLVTFKLSFGRDKDWVDLRRVVEGNRDLDLSYVERQLIGMRGPTMYPRIARLRVMEREARLRESR
jgi:hypothetical protein